MDITITLTTEQAANGAVVGAGDVRGLCQRLIDAEAKNWAEIASQATRSLRLAKLAAAPKELRDAIDAVKLDAKAGV